MRQTPFMGETAAPAGAASDKTAWATTTVALVRHGQTDANQQQRLQGREDRELNEKGKEQVRLSAEHLAAYHWDLLVSSPTRRALQSAELIAHRLDIGHVEVVPDLMAREPGEAYNLTPREIDNRFPDGHVPGSESREHVRERAMRSLNHLARAHGGKRILIVAHREGINGIVWLVSGGQLGTGISQLKIGSITQLEFRQGEWRLADYNATGHLDGLAHGQDR
ncbi:MAG: histidine phosphatase family protein [Chloroflexia bacterium]|nr:histidine phosphatase family protein [Chloroflexia bacterium]